MYVWKGLDDQKECSRQGILRETVGIWSMRVEEEEGEKEEKRKKESRRVVDREGLNAVEEKRLNRPVAGCPRLSDISIETAAV